MPAKPSNNDAVMRALADLAGAVGKGFEDMRGEFAEVNDHFEKVDGRLRSLETHAESVDHELREMRGQLDRIETLVLKDHERRLGAIEKKIGTSR